MLLRDVQVTDNGGHDWFVKSINPAGSEGRSISRPGVKDAATRDLDSTWIPPKFCLAPLVAPPTGVPIFPDN
jgi:hypothetical protein